jgi:hypothetical protein
VRESARRTGSGARSREKHASRFRRATVLMARLLDDDDLAAEGIELGVIGLHRHAYFAPPRSSTPMSRFGMLPFQRIDLSVP